MKKIIIASALLLISRVCCAYSIGADLISKMYYKNISLEKTYEVYKNFFLQEGFVLNKVETKKVTKDKYNNEKKIIHAFFSYKPTKPYFSAPSYGFKLTEIKVKEKSKNIKLIYPELSLYVIRVYFFEGEKIEEKEIMEYKKQLNNATKKVDQEIKKYFLPYVADCYPQCNIVLGVLFKDESKLIPKQMSRPVM